VQQQLEKALRNVASALFDDNRSDNRMKNLHITRRKGTNQAYQMISKLPAYRSTTSEIFPLATDIC
jgi:hypothetical protein